MSTPVSGSPYIIICQARINLALAKDDNERIQAVSNGAATLTAFMQIYYKHFKNADCLNLSTLQHTLMEHVQGKIPLAPEQVAEKIKVMVREMYEMEKRFA